MKHLLKLLTLGLLIGALNWGVPAQAQCGMLLCGAGSGGTGVLPGPPTFTNQVATAAATNASQTSTWTGLSLGSSTANASREVTAICDVKTEGSGTPTATFNSGAATVTLSGPFNPNSDQDGVLAVTGIISIGSTFNMVLTYPNGPGPNFGVCAVYTSDITTMLSPTPQVPPPNTFASNESNLSITTSALVTYSGSVVLLGWFGNGVSGSPVLTSDASLNVDGNFGNFAVFASANSVTASAASHATMTLAGAGENNMGMFVFR
jgi:hypothetical protein